MILIRNKWKDQEKYINARHVDRIFGDAML